MKLFTHTYAGRAAIAVALAALLLAWPPSLAWLTAAYCLTYAVRQLRVSFRTLEAEAAAENTGGEGPIHSSPRHAPLSCDMDAVMANLTARYAPPKTR